MRERIFKNWKTTLIGLLVIGYEIYKILVLKEAPDWGSAISLLFSIGFVSYKSKSNGK